MSSTAGSASGSTPKRTAPRRPLNLGRRRIGLGALALGLIVLLTLLRSGAGLFTDYLWFNQLSVAGVWGQITLIKTVLGVGFTLLLGSLAWLMVWLAQRQTPKFVRFAPNEEVLAAVHRLSKARPRVLRLILAGLSGITVGPVMSTQWNNWLLFRNGGTFGQTVPKFGHDVGFYVFTLPFLSALIGWLFAACITLLLVSVFAHAVSGSLRFGQGLPKATRYVRTHITLFLAVIALLKSVSYWIDRFKLTLSTNGYVVGASYTDLVARRRGLELLALLSLVVAGLLLFSLRRPTIRVPLIGGAVWLVVALITTGIYPRVLGRFVQSDEQNKERASITANIAATRAAFGLDRIVSSELPLEEVSVAKADATVDPAIVPVARQSVQNIRIWEPSEKIAGNAFRATQLVKPFYSFGDVDVDRYLVDGKLTPVLVAAREVSFTSDIKRSWVKTRLAYTHGYGLVVAEANSSNSSSLKFLSGNTPRAKVNVRQPRIYFGETTNSYAIVGSKTPEVDLGTEASGKPVKYTGKGGVAIGGAFRRLLFSLRFGDANLLISKEVTSQSRLMYVRDVRSRAEAIAPFVHFDSDPYPVMVNDRIVWVLEGYTTTSQYPYAQSGDTDSLSSRSGLLRSFNYVRNSVKVVVDAYDGTTRFFAFDSPDKNGKMQADPILSAYRRAFPSLFRPSAEFERDYPGLSAHIRYPEDLFRVQSAMLGRYHVTDPDEFYKNSSRWDISDNPGDAPIRKEDPKTADNGPSIATAPTQDIMRPYYVFAAPPGQNTQQFFIQSNLVTWTETNRQNLMRAIFTAQSSLGGDGKLHVYTAPEDKQIVGPKIIVKNMASNDIISRAETQLGAGGSVVRYGSTQVLPIGRSLLFVRPMFVQGNDTSDSNNSNPPNLNYVAVSYQGRIGFEPTLDAALRAVGLDELTAAGLGKNATPVPAPVNTGDGKQGSALTSEETLTQVAQLLEEAQAALKANDLGKYQAKVDAAREVLRKQAAKETVTSTVASTTTSTAAANASTVTTATVSPSSTPSSVVPSSNAPSSSAVPTSALPSSNAAKTPTSVSVATAQSADSTLP